MHQLFKIERLRALGYLPKWQFKPLNIKDMTKESQSSWPNDLSLLMGVLRIEAQLMLFLKLVDWEYEEFHDFLLKLSDR